MLPKFTAIGIVGGAIYDALLAACALKAKAETLFTWNLRHYGQFGPEVTEFLGHSDLRASLQRVNSKVGNGPFHSLQTGLAFAPKTHTGGANPRHDAQAFGLRVKCRVTQKAPDKFSGFIIGDIQPGQPVRSVRPIRPEEMLIQREEHWLR